MGSENKDVKREPKAARHNQTDLAINTNVEPKKRFDESEASEAKSSSYPEKYRAFEKLDGTHPWTQAVPEGFIAYPVRNLNEGRVTYFNYDLAKEMGLIEPNHPHQMNKQLENILLETFAIRIINEYDTKVGKSHDRVKPNKYMATRYLQLQHTDKQGRTSGDGRSIWNGVCTANGKTWDVSSRGTGVTSLSPGSAEAGKPLRTGGRQFGYGCGLADVDELYGSALMSEIFHRQGIQTERMLVIIDIGKNLGIGVRAHTNLIRPAHLFSYLKQGNYNSLRQAASYLIDRQVKNKVWNISSKGPSRYDEMAMQIAKSFAHLAARLEMDYIFVWMDWDGDNILADGSIIDYGSVRQFGLCHDQYRYDDVDRYSTNLTEQRLKARQIVQTFVQIAHFLRTGTKKAFADFNQHKTLEFFDKTFQAQKDELLLYRVGFSKDARTRILSRHRSQFESFSDVFKYFEKIKTTKKTEKVADGVNRPAIFNMRDLLRELPHLLIENKGKLIPSEILFNMIISSHANKLDMEMSKKQNELLQDFQVFYLDLVEHIRGRRAPIRYLQELASRAAIINKADRITGNAITVIVDEIMSETKKGLSAMHIQTIMDTFIHSQILVPERYLAIEKNLKKVPPKSRAIMKTLLRIVEENREDI